MNIHIYLCVILINTIYLVYLNIYTFMKLLDFCILCINDLKILKFFNKLSKLISTILHRETSQVVHSTEKRPYDVSRGQNRYVTLP